MKRNIMIAVIAIALASCGGANTNTGTSTGTDSSTGGTTGNTASGTSNGTSTGAGGANIADSTGAGMNKSSGTDTSGTAKGAQAPGTISTSADTSKNKMDGKGTNKKGSGKMSDTTKNKM